MLVPLLRQHRWANLTLLDFCMTLTPGQLNTNSPGQYGPIRDTWAHMAEERFLEAAATGTVLPPSPPGAPPPLEELRERFDRTGKRLLELAATLDEQRRITGTFEGQPFEMPAYIPLIQVIQHGAEHRTNITTTIANLGLTAPTIDAWAYWQAGEPE